MIIVEGPDGAGKTSLIEDIQELFDIEVAPRVVSKDAEAMVDLREWVDENLARGFQYKIFDRHRLISEPVYGPILRKDQESGFDKMEWLAPRMKQFYRIEPVIIYCLPPLEEVKQNIWNDPNDDNAVVKEHIDGIYSAYVARASLDEVFSPGIVKVWDYTRSLKIQDKPAWIRMLFQEIRERLY